MTKNEEKYKRPVSSSKHKETTKESERVIPKEKTMNYAQYKSKQRPQSGVYK